MIAIIIINMMMWRKCKRKEKLAWLKVITVSAWLIVLNCPGLFSPHSKKILSDVVLYFGRPSCTLSRGCNSKHRNTTAYEGRINSQCSLGLSPAQTQVWNTTHCSNYSRIHLINTCYQHTFYSCRKYQPSWWVHWSHKT